MVRVGVGAHVSQLQESERALRFKIGTLRNLLLKRLSCLKGAHWWKGEEPQVSEWGLKIPAGQKVPTRLGQQRSQVLVLGNGFISATLGECSVCGVINHDPRLGQETLVHFGSIQGTGSQLPPSSGRGILGQHWTSWMFPLPGASNHRKGQTSTFYRMNRWEQEQPRLHMKKPKDCSFLDTLRSPWGELE